jgi:hypothetical protein
MREIPGLPRVGSAGTADSPLLRLPLLLRSTGYWSHLRNAMGILGGNKSAWIGRR